MDERSINNQLKHKNKSSTINVVRIQRKNIENKIKTLKGTNKEANKIQEGLQIQKALMGSINSNDDSLIQQFMIELGEDLGIVITDSLDASQRDKDLMTKVKNVKPNFRKIRNKYQNRKYITASEFKESLRKFEIALSKATTPEEQSTKAYKALEEIYKLLQDYTPPENWSGENTKSIWDRIGKGGHISLEKYPELRDNVGKLLSRGEALVTTGALANKVGVIGEEFVAAALAITYDKEKELTYEALKGLMGKSKITFSPNGLSVRIAGEDKSKKGFLANQNQTSSQLANFIGKAKEEKIGEKSFYHFNATDDKVDVEIRVTPESFPINISVKNYSNPSVVTILSGNIFPILAMYENFINHYVWLVISRDKALDSDINSLYQAIKFTTGFHALVGGVKALNKDNNIITTPTASYFVVNDNKRTDKNSIQVFNTKIIAEKIITDTELIELINGENIMSQYYPKKGLDNRFSNIQVELRLAQLKKSISKNKN